MPGARTGSGGPDMEDHYLLMALGCIGAFALVFLLPAFGVGADISFLAFVVAMAACHLLMMRGHGAGNAHGKTKGGHEHH